MLLLLLLVLLLMVLLLLQAKRWSGMRRTYPSCWGGASTWPRAYESRTTSTWLSNTSNYTDLIGEIYCRLTWSPPGGHVSPSSLRWWHHFVWYFFPPVCIYGDGSFFSGRREGAPFQLGLWNLIELCWLIWIREWLMGWVCVCVCVCVLWLPIDYGLIGTGS